MGQDKTLILAGAKPKRVRLRVVKAALETTTWSSKGVAKVAKKTFSSARAAADAFRKALRGKLRDDYVYLGEPHTRGDVILEAFAPGGGGGAVLDMSLDGRFIVTASITKESNFGSKLEIVEVATGARQIIVDERGGKNQCFLHAARFDREAKAVYFVLNDDTFRVELGTAKRKLLATGTGFNPFVVQPSFDRERRRLAICAKHAIRVLDENGAKLLDVPTKSKLTECRAARISPSGRLLAVYIASRGIIYDHEDAKHDTTNEVQIWDIEAGVLWETVTVAEKVHDVGLTPDDNALVVTWDYAQGPIGLEIPSGRALWRFVAPDSTRELGRAYAWTYSPDGKLIAIAGDTLKLYDAKTRKVALELHERFGRVDCVTFSSDGRRLAASIDGTAVVHAL